MKKEKKKMWKNKEEIKRTEQRRENTVDRLCEWICNAVLGITRHDTTNAHLYSQHA